MVILVGEETEDGTAPILDISVGSFDFSHMFTRC